MKKIVLFFFSVIILASSSQAQQLSEGFEGLAFPPPGWTTVAVKGERHWVRSSTKRRTGLASAFVNQEILGNGSNGLGEQWLISPKIYQIKSGDKVSFYCSAEQSQSNEGTPYYDTLEIWISTTGTQPADFTTRIAKVNLDGLGVGWKAIKNLNGNNDVLFPAAVYGQDVYVALRYLQNQGNGLYIDDFTAGTKFVNDIMSAKTSLRNMVFRTGQAISFNDTLYNNGTGTVPANIPVSYQIGDGSVLATVNTAAAIAPGSTAIVSFTGANAFTPAAPGTYQMKVFTDWSADQNRSNDTIIYNLVVQDPIATLPYFMDFSNPQGWTQAGNDFFTFLSQASWSSESYTVTNPAGNHPDSAAFAYTYDPETAQDSMILRSPLLNFTGMQKPMLNFYVAASFPINSNLEDELSVSISTDGGLTYVKRLYHKSNSTSSKLRTVVGNAQSTRFVPSAPSQWRLEIVDLSDFANQPNVIIAFNVVSGANNNVWIDNVKILDQPVSSYTAERVTAAGQTVTGYRSTIKFNSIPAIDSVRIEGHEAMPLNRRDENDRFANNTGNTSADGTVSTPNIVYDRYWTIGYAGNTENKASFDISLDITGLAGVIQPDKAYIVRRADETGKWEALPTTRPGGGSILRATGLVALGDFAIGYYSAVVPVTVLDFSGKSIDHAIKLNWNTSQEANILSYDIEKWSGAAWEKIGNQLSSRNSMQNNYAFTDLTPLAGLNLYRLKIHSEMGTVTYSDVAKVMFAFQSNKIYQNTPNPVRTYTIIRYELAKDARVKIMVYDINGKVMATLENSAKKSGSHEVRWNAGDVPAGTYFYRVIIDNESTSKSMIKLR